MTFGIIGNGVVGGTLRRWLCAKSGVRVYDKDILRSNATLCQVLEADWMFICINLTDNAAGEESMAILANYIRWYKGTNPVVLKSTIVPGTCDWLEQATGKAIVYNPEFLTEARPWEDFTQPQMQVFGCRGEVDVTNLVKLLPGAPFYSFVTLRQAEWLKHGIAGFLATKVSWFNQLYDALGEEEFKIVRDLMIHDSRVGASHTDIKQDGYRGWGGKCFTKDVPAFAEAGGMPIMREVVDYNKKLMEVVVDTSK